MNVIVIGSGFAGLSTAATLANDGYNVTLLEKNNDIGGRARQFKHKGFLFDMGPSWYWMPDVFEKFFNKFNKSVSDYYDLIKLNPGFQMIFDEFETIQISSSFNEIKELFEKIEPGSSRSLELFMKEAEFKYKFSMEKLIYNPGLSFFEFFNKGIFKNILNLDLLKSYKKHVHKSFKNPKLRALLEFPVLFLGTAPEETPALYSLMAYSGFVQGTYYPDGGFVQVIKGIERLCLDLGVTIKKNQCVKKINVKEFKVESVETQNNHYSADIVVAAADYEHVDNSLLEKKYRNYNNEYWDKRVMSPSCLLFYLGIDKKINKLTHHNLFFDSDIDQHIYEIYSKKIWPTDPLFYVSCPSKTDKKVAPSGMENLFLLIPISPGSKDNEETREYYFDLIINRLENYCNTKIRNHIIYNRSYCINDFVSDYNAYKGNAYGLANTLFQTANFKPRMINKKVSNLYYTGQLTVPGPGVPPSLISGQIIGDLISKKYK